MKNYIGKGDIMPLVETSLTISDIKLEKLWENICCFDKYPKSMENVIDVQYLDENENLTSWKVLLNGSELTWVEKDIFLPYEKIKFEQVEGDLEVYKGEWRIKYNELKSEATVILIIEFDLGIPSLEEILNPIGIEAIKTNSYHMLNAIKSM